MRFSSTYQILFYLKSFRSFILFGGILSVIICLLILLYYPKSFESSAIIYNTNNANKLSNAQNEQAIQDVNDGYTIINWVYSTELINHLISKFDLYVHYRIDTTQKDYNAECFNEVSQNVAVSMTPYNAVKITVSDIDGKLASSMANEILNKVDGLNAQMFIARKKQVVHEYEVLLDELSNEVTAQRDSIKELVRSLAQIQGTSGRYSAQIENTINSLNKSHLQYENVLGEWMNAKKAHLLSLKYLEKYNLPSFVIIQYALPEVPEHIYSLAHMGFIMLAFIAGLWTVIFGLLILAKYSIYFKILFSSSFSESDKRRIIPLDSIKEREEGDEGLSKVDSIERNS